MILHEGKKHKVLKYADAALDAAEYFKIIGISSKSISIVLL